MKSAAPEASPHESLLTAAPHGSPRIRTSYTFDPGSGRLDDGLVKHEDCAEHGITDNMQYRTKNLTTWNTFSMSYASVWVKRELWIMMFRLGVVAFVVCIVTALVVPNPAVMKVAKFTQVSKFLNVVVGLLLGFFLSSTMTRWHACVEGFLSLSDAVRNIQIQFVALGVPEEVTVKVLRYGYASAWLLYYQLLVETQRLEDPNVDCEWRWTKMRDTRARIDKTGMSLLLTEKEINQLRKTRDPAYILWTWVAVILGRLSQDGWIPAMNSPTYGRIMNICQGAHTGLRDVAGAVAMQAPLSYVHMLATLVHVNNLINAVTFGIVSGLACGTALIAHGLHFYKKGMGLNVAASVDESVQDWQNMIVTFLYCFFGPLLYQAMLIVAMSLAQPFDGNDVWGIPLDRLIHSLEVDMCDSRDAVDNMDIKRPYFKEPLPPAAIKQYLTSSGMA